MHLLCTLSRHRPAPAAIENQGFLFSRCQRCSHDLVSSSSETPSWQPVPDGFRVAWRETDLSVFASIPLTHRAWAGMRRKAVSARDGVHLAATIASWHVSDGRRRLKDRAVGLYRSGRGALRLTHARQPNDPCVVIVNLTLRRDLTLDTVGAMLRHPPRDIAA